MKLSIIIPTYNRPTILKWCLEALAKQTLSKKLFEIIVVHDNKPCGPAWARNVGLKKAKGSLLLFLGDDIIAPPDLIKNHLHFHQHHPQNYFALTGKVVWHSALKIDPFMEWLQLSGLQANYQDLKNNQLVSYTHFYTTNLSLKKDFLIKNGLFDENFKYPLFEDTELGYRLSQKGMKLYYSAKAMAYHYHPIKFKSYLKKMLLRGKVGRQLIQKHPELKDKIFPTHLPAKEIIRLKFWQMFYPLGKLLNSRKILFNNYQRLVNEALIKYFFLNKRQTPNHCQRGIKIKTTQPGKRFMPKRCPLPDKNQVAPKTVRQF